MRVSVIGCGSIGRRHISNLLALGCEVHAMDVSVEARALASSLGAASVSDVARFDVDALVIATPWDRHLAWVEEAIRRQIPMFIEKPLGSLEQLPRWREIAAMDLPVHQVGYMLRFHPAIRTLREFVPNPRSGGFYCDCDMRTWPGHAYGPWLLECSHEIDLALWCGFPGVATATSSGTHSVDVWADDERWLLSVDARSESYVRHWCLGSSKRDASARFHAPEELGVEMYRDEMAHFLARVRGERDLGDACDLAQALKVLEVCQQVEQMTKATA